MSRILMIVSVTIFCSGLKSSFESPLKKQYISQIYYSFWYGESSIFLCLILLSVLFFSCLLSIQINTCCGWFNLIQDITWTLLHLFILLNEEKFEFYLLPYFPLSKRIRVLGFCKERRIYVLKWPTHFYANKNARVVQRLYLCYDATR